jgi:hypothetical protein
LIGLHVWASTESYQVLGAYGWFFGDFFIEHVPAALDYTGIYRYLNNPEIFGGAAFFGFALITRSRLVFALALAKHGAHWWFLSFVEQCVPHPVRPRAVLTRRAARTCASCTGTRCARTRASSRS